MKDIVTGFQKVELGATTVLRALRGLPRAADASKLSATGEELQHQLGSLVEAMERRVIEVQEWIASTSQLLYNMLMVELRKALGNLLDVNKLYSVNVANKEFRRRLRTFAKNLDILEKQQDSDQKLAQELLTKINFVGGEAFGNDIQRLFEQRFRLMSSLPNGDEAVIGVARDTLRDHEEMLSLREEKVRRCEEAIEKHDTPLDVAYACCTWSQCRVDKCIEQQRAPEERHRNSSRALAEMEAQENARRARIKELKDQTLTAGRMWLRRWSFHELEAMLSEDRSEFMKNLITCGATARADTKDFQRCQAKTRAAEIQRSDVVSLRATLLGRNRAINAMKLNAEASVRQKSTDISEAKLYMEKCERNVSSRAGATSHATRRLHEEVSELNATIKKIELRTGLNARRVHSFVRSVRSVHVALTYNGMQSAGLLVHLRSLVSNMDSMFGDKLSALLASRNLRDLASYTTPDGEHVAILESLGVTTHEDLKDALATQAAAREFCARIADALKKVPGGQDLCTVYIRSRDGQLKAGVKTALRALCISNESDERAERIALAESIKRYLASVAEGVGKLKTHAKHNVDGAAQPQNGHRQLADEYEGDCALTDEQRAVLERITALRALAQVKERSTRRTRVVPRYRRKRAGETPRGGLAAVDLEEASNGRVHAEEARTERIAVDEACGDRVPVEEACGERIAVEEACGGQVPVEEGCGERVPTAEAFGDRVPVEEACGDRVPVEEACGERVPVEEGCGERVPTAEACGERVLVEEARGERKRRAYEEEAPVDTKTIAKAALVADKGNNIGGKCPPPRSKEGSNEEPSAASTQCHVPPLVEVHTTYAPTNDVPLENPQSTCARGDEGQAQSQS